MEIKARYRLIGLFMLVVTGLGFGFVYWLQNAGGLTQRKTYQIRFIDTVAGLQVGAPVLFDGLRVGEVSAVTLDRSDPHLIIATIGIDKSTPLRADTTVRIETQGLMGSPSISLYGGSADLPALNSMPHPPEISAGASAGQGLTDMAREALGRVDKLLADNSTDLHDTISNFKTFSGSLAKNSGKIDTILGGLEKTFAAPPKPAMAIYDLTPPTDFAPASQPPKGTLTIADPTTLLTFDTQQILLKPEQGSMRAIENAQWGDSLPQLIQENLVQSFENAHYIGAVTKPLDGFDADYRLLIDLRAFDIALSPAPHAVIAFTAKILSKDGKILGAKLVEAEAPVQADGKGVTAAAAAAALQEAFRKTATDTVAFATPLVFADKPLPASKPRPGQAQAK